MATSDTASNIEPAAAVPSPARRTAGKGKRARSSGMRTVLRLHG